MLRKGLKLVEVIYRLGRPLLPSMRTASLDVRACSSCNDGGADFGRNSNGESRRSGPVTFRVVATIGAAAAAPTSLVTLSQTSTTESSHLKIFFSPV